MRETTRPPERPAKLPYRRPELRELGSVADLTKTADTVPTAPDSGSYTTYQEYTS